MAGGLVANMTSSNYHVQQRYIKDVVVHPTWYLTSGKEADIALLMVR